MNVSSQRMTSSRAERSEVEGSCGSFLKASASGSLDSARDDRRLNHRSNRSFAYLGSDRLADKPIVLSIKVRNGPKFSAAFANRGTVHPISPSKSGRLKIRSRKLKPRLRIAA